MKPQDWKDTCTSCEEVISLKTGFLCAATGGKHIVAMKTFYHLGGKSVADPRQRRLWAPLLICKPGIEKRDPSTGETSTVSGVQVQFEQSGLYHTEDAEKQFYLMTKYELPYGPEGQKLWNQVYLTGDQQKVLLEDQLAKLQKQVDDQNNHLANVQQQTRVNEQAASLGRVNAE